MAKFRFKEATIRPMWVVDIYDVEAESYEDAVKKIQDADLDITQVGEYVSTDKEYLDEDDYYRGYSEAILTDENGVEIY